MNTLGISPHKIGRTEEETSKAEPDGEENGLSLMSHFHEKDFLEYTLGAFEKLKIKIQEVDMLVQLYEKELGVEKVRRFRKEVKFKLGSQLLSSGTDGNIRSSKIQNSQNWSTPLLPGNVKQMKTNNDNGKQTSKVAKDLSTTSRVVPVLTLKKSTKAYDEEARLRWMKEMKERSAELGRYIGGGTLRLKEPFPAKKRKMHTSNNNENQVSAMNNGNGKEDGDRAGSQAATEMVQSVEDTPENVLEQIRRRLKDRGSLLEFSVIACRKVFVGSYKVKDPDAGSLMVTFTPLGIRFTLPHSISKDRKVDLCIPKKNFVNLLDALDEKCPAISLRTDPRYATWIRDALGLDGNPSDENTNYYCPQKGVKRQRTIHFFAQSLSNFDKELIRKIFSGTLKKFKHAANNAD